ncbi:RDD family protein [Mycetocola zhujimingii]|uniref:RDD family protein n=1 Tax=Mycetocola zhujimingii TaxID=2079792 RepID=UPI001F1879D0|nr:RDD family protein [Mycetocola zhujimingii]
MTDSSGTQMSDLSDSSLLITGEAVALDVQSASFILRAAGAIIDFLVSVLVAAGLLWLLFVFAVQGVIDQSATAAFSTAIIAFSTVVLPTTIETLSHGRSLGKLAIGARIVRDDGGATGFRHAFIRALVGFFEIYMTLGGVAAITGLLSARSKRLGDLLAGTYAQQERVPRAEHSVYGVPPALQGWATIADVGRMPDRLSRRIAQFLDQVDKLTPETRARLGQNLAAEAAAFVSPVPDTDPVLFLYAVAAVRRDREYAAHMLEQERLGALTPVLTGRPHGFPER